MIEDSDQYPEWLRNQRGFRNRGHDQIPLGSTSRESRTRIIRRYANELIEAGQPVTLGVIRGMLRYLDRGYSLKPDQISRALCNRYAEGTVARYSNATSVLINGERHRSIRAAAEALGVSPQTVINRIKSKDAKWKKWRREE